MHERGTQLLLVVSTLKSQCKPKERTACLSNEHAKLYCKFLGRHEATFGELVVGDEAGSLGAPGWSLELSPRLEEQSARSLGEEGKLPVVEAAAWRDDHCHCTLYD